MKRYEVDYNDKLEASVIISGTEYGTTDTRREECHGYHYFEDKNIGKLEIHRVILNVNGNEIDLTGRLTDEEMSIFEDI
jgi:hypothetical protein